MIRRRPFARWAVPPTRQGTRHRAPADADVVVCGGGIAGLAAATVLAERGVRVTVVEAEQFLGGRAGSFDDELRDGTRFQMERGFHGFFRQYYNLREFLRRVDPELRFLTPLEDYPLLGPGGRQESFRDLPRRAPFNIAELVRRSKSLRIGDLRRIAMRPATAMLAYHEATTYARYDHMTAGEYLDSLRFPPDARQMLFDVFSHSFFNPEEDYAASELLMNFHFYFVGNPEGLVFDVMNDPFSKVFFDPLRSYLEDRGVNFVLGERVTGLEESGDGFRVGLSSGGLRAQAVILGLSIPGLQKVVDASRGLFPAAFERQVNDLQTTLPFVVWRLWLDRKVRPERSAFAGTAGLGFLDNISIYELFEKESSRWSAETGGSVVELHAYAVPEEATEDEVRADLLRALHETYPETREATVLEERYLHRRDCPGFPPGSYARRPGVRTPVRGVALAGDYVRTPFPSALMERAAATGMMAANEVGAQWDLVPETLYSVPTQGLLSFKNEQLPGTR